MCYLTQSQQANTWPTSPSADPTTPGAWPGSHWSTNVQVTGMTQPGKRSTAKAGMTQPGKRSTAKAGMTQPRKRSTAKAGMTQPGKRSTTKAGMTQPGKRSTAKAGMTQPGKRSTAKAGMTQPGKRSTAKAGMTQPGKRSTAKAGMTQPGKRSTARAGMTQPGKRSTVKAGTEPRSAALEADALPLGQRGGSERRKTELLLFVGCLTSRQHASVSQRWICSDKFYVLAHWHGNCRSNFLPHPVTAY